MCSGMLIQFGNLKGSWLSNQFTKLLMTKCSQALPVRIHHAFVEENKSFSACICPGVYVDAFLTFLFGDTHICISGLKIFQNFTLRRILFIYKIEVFFWKCEHVSIFQLCFPLGNKVYVLYMSCILRCYLRWIVSRHGYRYSSEHGSWSCFWWRGSQPA